jgi:cytosine/adenosine deaminase-related metal-dependent hydrolase
LSPAAFILSPEDVYISVLMGSLEGLNAGVTTTVDFAHMTWSRAHTDAALQGVLDSGARIWWCPEPSATLISVSPFTRQS